MCYKWQRKLISDGTGYVAQIKFYLPFTFLTSLFISYFLTVNYLFIYK